MNFEEVYNNYLQYVEKRHKKQGFVTIHESFSNHILPYFQGRNISSLTKLDIMDWQNKILI